MAEGKILSRLLILENVFGLEGIQTRIVNKYLPMLNIAIKEFMDVLTNGEMGVHVFINEKSKVDIRIRGGSADLFSLLSGGEKMLVRLAVDIGLALLSFSRSSQKPEIICLDEIFGPLDNSHTDAVFNLLNKLQQMFNRVLVISHKPMVQDLIKNRILVEKEDGDYGRTYIKKIEYLGL